MARAGILYSHVAHAAAKLLADGKNPTVDNVREAMGSTGSKSTIGPFLKRWKAEQQDAIAEAESGLPAPLLHAVKGLHQHIQAEACQRIEQAQQVHDAALSEAAEREKHLRTGHQAALAANAALTEELVRARETLSQLSTAHHAQTVALATVQAENAGLRQRLADRAAEVGALNHQLSQSRKQFEHYQEATASQRAEERSAAEQRIARLEQDLAGAQHHITAQQITIGQKEVTIDHLTAEQARHELALRATQEDLASTCTSRDRLAGLLEDETAAKEQAEIQLGTVQQKLMDSRTELAARVRETELLIEQLRRAEERTNQLTEEKAAWLQERGALLQRTLAAEQKTAVLVDSSAKP